MIRKTALIVAAITVPVFLSGCGYTTGDRAASGAGIGAVAGVIGGAMLGAPLAGAVIGGAAGAAVGGLTTPSQVELGKPVWKDN